MQRAQFSQNMYEFSSHWICLVNAMRKHLHWSHPYDFPHHQQQRMKSFLLHMFLFIQSIDTFMQASICTIYFKVYRKANNLTVDLLKNITFRNFFTHLPKQIIWYPVS